MKKLLLQNYSILIAALITFFLNIFKNHQLSMAALSSLILFLSWVIFKVNHVQNDDLSKNRILSSAALSSLGLIPLLAFRPWNHLATVSLVLALILFIFYKKILYIKWLILLVILILLVLGNFISATVIEINPETHFYSFNKQHTVYADFTDIFLNNGIPLTVSSLKSESHLRYKIASVVYSNFAILPYYLSARLSQFFSLRNFYSILLLANLYPLCIGIYFYFKNFKEQNKLLLVWLTISLVIISINKSQDASSSLYMSTPILLFFIFLGLTKINLKLYLALLPFSLFIFLAPL